MRVPLAFKIIGFLAALVFVVSASTWALLSRQEERVIEDAQRRNAELLIQAVDHGVSASMIAGNKDAARSLADDLAVGHEISRVVIYSAAGSVWHDSDGTSTAPLVGKSEAAAVAATGKDRFLSTTADGEPVFIAVSAIPSQEACFRCHTRAANLGAVGVSLSTRSHREALARDRRSLVIASMGAGAVATIVLGLFLTFLLVRPIQRLSTTAKAITEGDLELRSDVKGRDEIGDLARAFNTMTGRLERQITDLEATRAELQETIERVGQAISSAHKLDELADVLAREAVRIARADAAAMLLFSEQGDLLVVGARGLSTDSLTSYNARPVRRSDPLVAWFKSRSLPDTFDPSGEPDRAHLAILPGARTHCAIPITHEGRVLGFISIAALEATQIAEDAKRLLYALASQAGLAVDQIRLNEQAKVMAITDGLTELYNHRYFRERLDSEFERARRFEHPLSVIMIDVDHFKQFNDRHGHLAGDALLQRLGELLRDSVRRVDMAARYGGEEFAVMLVETGRAEAMAFAERLRAAVEAEHLASSIAADASVTVSIGVAGHPSAADSAEALIETADRGLYKAKADGRNLVRAVEAEAGAGDGIPRSPK